MKQILSRLEKAFPFLHERSATEEDFYAFCAEKRVEVVHTPDISHGVYVMFAGRHFIFLNSKLRGLMLLYVMYHELAHYLFHAPSRSDYAVEFFDPHVESFRSRTRRKIHCEAEAVAAWLLIPTMELHTVLQSHDTYLSDELQVLIATRLDLWSRYRK
jgi:Zn-dependent peptidase ImmA (M78 family)